VSHHRHEAVFPGRAEKLNRITLRCKEFHCEGVCPLFYRVPKLLRWGIEV